jgi:hypothetical protein
MRQNASCIAIGNNAGQSDQLNRCIAIGTNAGQNRQGENSIAIGNNAGINNQVKNSIILNASEQEVNSINEGLYINPIRGSVYNNPLNYNPKTKEITVLTQKELLEIKDVNINSEMIYKLKPKSYTTKENNSEEIGYLLQDVLKVNKEFVNCYNGEVVNINYNVIIMSLIEEIRKLKEKIQ